MKNLVLVIVGVALCAACKAADKSGAEQRLQAALQHSDLFHNATSSFVLEADVTSHFAQNVKGHLTIQWKSKNHWRRELILGPYRETVIRRDEWEYATRNTGFTLKQADQVDTLLKVATQPTGFKAKGEKVRHTQGKNLNCIEEVASNSSEREVCVDAATNEIASEKLQNRGVTYLEADFSGYTEFSGVSYPNNFALVKDDAFATSIAITRLVEADVDEKLLDVPAGSVARRKCDGIIPPVDPENADLSGLVIPGGSGVVEMALTIMKDGSVGMVQVQAQSSEELAEKIRRRALTWKFKPAMCGNEPVVSDTQITLGFGP